MMAPSAAHTPWKRYLIVEVPWLLDDGRTVRNVTLTGHVNAYEEASLMRLVLEDGDELPVPADERAQAARDLVQAAYEMWRQR